MKHHQYPDNTLETRLRERGYEVRCMWQIKGPKDTAVKWMEYLFVTNDTGMTYGAVIVQTFDGGGWNAFVEASRHNDIASTVEAVVKTLTKET